MTNRNSSPPDLFLIGDTAEGLQKLSELLGNHGFSPRTGLDTVTALECIKQTPPDLVVLDIHRSAPWSYDLCQRLNTVTSGRLAAIPVIFLSVIDDVVQKVKAFEAGAADYIPQPVHPSEVIARINYHLAICQRYQRLLAEMQEQQQAEQTLETSLHVVSHDLRNPVLGLSLILENCLQQTTADQIPLPRQTIEQMQKSCERQLTLINSLVETHQFEKNGIPLMCRPVNFTQMLAELVETWALPLEKQAVALTLHCPEMVPVVEADTDYLWRVLDNLFANTLKYNPLPRTHPLAVKISLTVESDWLCCSVADNGVGIDAEIADRVFERYQRGDGTKKTIGLGLGLYLCRQIIGAHNGQIGLTLDRSQGTEVWFRLPLVR